MYMQKHNLVYSSACGQQCRGSGCTNSIQYTFITEEDNGLNEIEECSTILVLILHIYCIVSQLREILHIVFEYFPTRILTS